MLGIDIFDASILPAALVSVLAGLISFLSPCVLPIVPPYLAYMSGISLDNSSQKRNVKVVLVATSFVLGLSTVFLILGLAASSFGILLLGYKDFLTTLAGLLIMGFGLHFLGIVHIPLLNREVRFDTGKIGVSFFGAYLLGLAFAFGWTPCLGPILSTILTLAAQETQAARGAILLGTYAAGLGIPFLLIAIFFPRLKGPMAWMKRNMGVIEKVSGALLVVIGLLLLTGRFAMLSGWLLDTFPVLGTIG